jgi:AcrR family transcriptional regulator
LSGPFLKLTDSQSYFFLLVEHSKTVPSNRLDSPRFNALLDAARAQFITSGYAATPVSAIVKAAGVAQGTFYLYFESKQAVLAELRRQVFRDYEKTLHSVLRFESPADEAMARVIVAMADAVERNLELERVFRHAESAEATLQAAREGRARLADVAAERIRQGHEAGNVKVDSPKWTARFLITLYDHVIYEALAYDAQETTDVIAECVRFGLRSLGAADERIEDLVAQHQTWRTHE